MKSLFVQSLNDASVLNDVFLRGAHSLKEILSEYMDHAFGLGGVDEVEAMFYEKVVECCDVVMGFEFAVEVGEDVSSEFDVWRVLVIYGGCGGEVLERTCLDFYVGEWSGGCHDVRVCFSCWTWLLGSSWLYIGKGNGEESFAEHWE